MLSTLNVKREKQESLGKRVVDRNGLISNVLYADPLADILSQASLIARTYKHTVQNNVYSIVMPAKVVCKHFPKISGIPAHLVCKKTAVVIEGQTGDFYGPANKANDIPSGYGVFVAGPQVSCG